MDNQQVYETLTPIVRGARSAMQQTPRDEGVLNEEESA